MGWRCDRAPRSRIKSGPASRRMEVTKRAGADSFLFHRPTLTVSRSQFQSPLRRPSLSVPYCLESSGLDLAFRPSVTSRSVLDRDCLYPRGVCEHKSGRMGIASRGNTLSVRISILRAAANYPLVQLRASPRPAVSRDCLRPSLSEVARGFQPSSFSDAANRTCAASPSTAAGGCV